MYLLYENERTVTLCRKVYTCKQKVFGVGEEKLLDYQLEITVWFPFQIFCWENRFFSAMSGMRKLLTVKDDEHL